MDTEDSWFPPTFQAVLPLFPWKILLLLLLLFVSLYGASGLLSALSWFPSLCPHPQADPHYPQLQPRLGLPCIARGTLPLQWLRGPPPLPPTLPPQRPTMHREKGRVLCAPQGSLVVPSFEVLLDSVRPPGSIEH